MVHKPMRNFILRSKAAPELNINSKKRYKPENYNSKKIMQMITYC